MGELADSLAGMDFVQLLLLFAFVISYMLALGGLLGSASRIRAAVLALGLAIAFAALTKPWVHGALLMAFVIAGLGLFVLLTWLLARLLGPRAPRSPIAAEPVLPSQPGLLRQTESAAQAGEIGAGARALR